MAENELEARLNKKIERLQGQVNSLGVYIKRVHGEITHPSTLAKMKAYVDKPIAEIQTTLGDWTDYATTSTILGWNTYTTKVLEYKLIGDIMFVFVSIDGVSNATGVTFTLPNAAKVDGKFKCLHCMDNGRWRAVNGVVSLSASSVIVTCTLDGDATAWTNANQKSIQGQFFYRTA